MVLEKRKIAFIDLSKKEVKTKIIPLKLRRLFLGGRGLSIYLLYNHLPPKTDPLSPNNVILVGTGLLGGVVIQGGRTQWMSKSPETGILADGNMGGFFGPELKCAGYEHLLIKGKAEKPVYLWIHDGEIEFMDAEHIWGMDNRFKAFERIRKDLGDPEVQIAGVGPAAEKLVRFANIMTDYKNSARAGTGCVMGSKNLKAIAVRGTMPVEVKYPEKLYEYMNELIKKILNMKWAKALSRYGTMLMIGPNNEMGALRTLNGQLNMLPDAKGIEADTMLENHVLKILGCWGCIIHCRHRHIVRSGPYATYGEGPEYVSVGQLGPIIGITELPPLLKLHNVCNEVGIDISSFGTLSAWLTELYQRGIIDKDFTDGMEMEWGNAETYVELARKIAYREGKFADLVAEGGKIASSKIGKNSADYLHHVKWLPDSTTHDVRVLKGYALGLVTGPRGSDHLRSRPTIEMFSLPEDLLNKWFGGKVSRVPTSYEGKERIVWWCMKMFAIPDSLGTCKFVTKGFNNVHGVDNPDCSKLIYYATGLDISPSEIEEVGERILTLERLFNNREAGISRKDDKLPPINFEPMPIGPSKGECIDPVKWTQMLERYYELRGFDKKGLPTKETLERLNLVNEPSHLL